MGMLLPVKKKKNTIGSEPTAVAALFLHTEVFIKPLELPPWSW